MSSKNKYTNSFVGNSECARLESFSIAPAVSARYQRDAKNATSCQKNNKLVNIKKDNLTGLCLLKTQKMKLFPCGTTAKDLRRAAEDS